MFVVMNLKLFARYSCRNSYAHPKKLVVLKGQHSTSIIALTCPHAIYATHTHTHTHTFTDALSLSFSLSLCLTRTHKSQMDLLPRRKFIMMN